MGTRQRAVKVSQLTSFNAPLQTQLERAVVSFHLRTSILELSLANGYERSPCLWVVSELLPVCAPGIDYVPELGPISFGNLGGNAILVGGDKAVAFSDANLSSWAGVVVPVGGCARRRGVSRIAVSVRFFCSSAGEH